MALNYVEKYFSCSKIFCSTVKFTIVYDIKLFLCYFVL